MASKVTGTTRKQSEARKPPVKKQDVSAKKKSDERFAKKAKGGFSQPTNAQQQDLSQRGTMQTDVLPEIPIQREPTVELTDFQKKPFMAVKMTEKGEPWYGSGFKGWARRTFAHMFDPDDIMLASSAKDWENIDALANQAERSSFGVLWDTKMKNRTGISAKDLGMVYGAAQTALDKDLLFEQQQKRPGTLGYARFGTRMALTTIRNAMGPKQLLFQLTTVLLAGENVIRKYIAAPALARRESGWGVFETYPTPEERAAFDELLPIYQAGKGAVYTQLFEGSELAKFLSAVQTKSVAWDMGVRQAAIDNYGSWESVPKPIQYYAEFAENFWASKTLWNSWLGNTRRQLFLDRVMAGEDPDFVALEEANPWVELAAGIVLDPLNLLGVGATEKLGKKMLTTAAMEYGEVVPEVVKAWELVARAGDDVPEAARLTRVALQSMIDASKARDLSMGDRAVKFGLFTLTSQGKQDVITKSVTNMLSSMMAGTGGNIDEIAEIVARMVKLGGDDAAESMNAAEAIIHSKFGNMILSPAGLDAAAVLRRFYDNGKLYDAIKAFSGNADGLAKAMSKKMFYAVQEMFPSIDEMASAARKLKKGLPVDAKELKWAQMFETLPKNKGMAIVAESHKIAQKYFYRPINTFFAGVYMGYNPGYMMRNIQNNFVTIMADSGIEPAVKALGSGVLEAFKPGSRVPLLRQQIVDTLGYLPGRFAGKGKTFVAAADVGGELKEGASTLEKIAKAMEGPVLPASQRAEISMATEAGYHFVTREMSKLLESGKWIPADEVVGMLRAGFTQNDVDLFSRLMAQFRGNEKKAGKEFVDMFAVGEVEEWRNLTANPRLWSFLNDSGLLPEVVRVQREAATPAEWERLMAEVKSAMEEATRMTGGEGLQIPRDRLDDFMLEVDSMVSSRLAESDDGAFLNASRYLYNEAEQRITNMFYDLTNKASEMGLRNNATAVRERVSGGLSSLAYDNSREFMTFVNKLSKRAGTENPTTLWQEARFILGGEEIQLGEIPLTVSPQTFRKALWDWAFENNGKFWSTLFKDRVTRYQEGITELIGAMRTTAPNMTEVDRLLTRAAEFGEMFTATRTSNAIRGLRNIPAGSTLDVMEPRSIPRLFNMVNSDRRAAGLAEAANASEITIEEVIQSVMRREFRGIMPGAEAARDFHVSPTRAYSVAWEDMERMYDDFVREVSSRWGETSARITNPEKRAALKTFLNEVTSRMTTAKTVIGGGAERMANFALLDYNKHGGDVALSYIFPYAYWYRGTYPNWVKRFANNPLLLTDYLKYRKFMETLHAGLPDWWKYNLSTNDIPGIDMDNPMFFNLEASLNPLNGMTGVDFDDPKRRVDWLSSFVDDLGKFGPTVWTPIQLLVAAHLYINGETEAARRYAGRLFPQTSTIKSLLNKLNIDIGTPYNEIDPFVLAFSGGLDPYEEARATRYLVYLVDVGQISQEQAEEARFLKEHGEPSPVWDRAVAESLGARALPNLASFTLGTGYKARSKSDLQIDIFYNDLYSILANRPNLDSRNYRAAMNTLFEKYPGAQAMLLSRRSGLDLDSAYAYSILQRVPPGDIATLLEMSGVDYSIYEQFYDSKGTFEGISGPDQERFMAMIADIGALLELPDGATRDEWNEAKATYTELYRIGDGLFPPLATTRGGKGSIWNDVDAYYSALREGNGDAFLQKFPEVEEALRWKESAIVGTPILYAYYGSLDTIWYYEKNQTEKRLVAKYGARILELEDGYYDLVDTERVEFLTANPSLSAYWEARDIAAKELGTESAEYRAWRKLQYTDAIKTLETKYYAIVPKKTAYLDKYPQLETYWEEKKKLRAQAVRKTVSFANNLPEHGILPRVRGDVSMTPMRTNMLEVTQREEYKPASYYFERTDPVTGRLTIAPPLQRLVMNYFNTGAELPSSVMQMLDSAAYDFGLGNDGERLLILIGIGLDKETTTTGGGNKGNIP